MVPAMGVKYNPHGYVTNGLKPVPGDWITGSRALDISILPILSAAAFPLLRMLLLRLIYQPTGEAVLARQLKKTDAKMTAAEQAEWMKKWTESAWKMTAFTILTITAFSVSVTEPWFTNPNYFWIGATQFPLDHHVPRKLLIAYIVEAGFYLQAIPFLCFTEVRRKDWFESMAHHIITSILIYYSFYANFMRVGVLVMQLHDVSDIFLEAAKLARYAKKDDLSMAFFVTFTVSWVYLRIWVYPRMIVLNCLNDPVELVAMPYNIDPQPHYAVFGTLFTVLFFLHVYWTWLILLVIKRALFDKKMDDVREVDD